MASNDQVSLDFVQGDTIYQEFEWLDDDDNPMDITGAVITSVLRKEYHKPILKSFTIIPINLSVGKFAIQMSAADTAELPVFKSKGKRQRITSFVWDLNVVQSNGHTQTPVKGYMKMHQEVTY